MQFRLTYEGPLRHKGKALPAHKHAIRKEFHSQLKRFWETHPTLISYSMFAGGMVTKMARLRKYQQGKFRFVPLVRERNGTIASLDILFLRSGRPGTLLLSADLDGRLKTLIDALRMPDQKQELVGLLPDPGEDPFFCLMEDDKLLSGLSITSDTLLKPTPLATTEFLKTHDCRVVITVTLASYESDVLPFNEALVHEVR